MDITIQHPAEGIAVIHLDGKFTIEDVNLFKEKTSPLASGSVTTILVDFTNLNYIDSSGIGTLILLMNSAKNQGIALIAYNLQREIQNVFKISYLDRFFNITTSQELKNHFPGIAL